MKTNNNYTELDDINATSTFKTNFFPADMFIVFDDDDEIYACTLVNRDDREDDKSVLYILGLSDDIVKVTVKTADLAQTAIHYPTIHLFRSASSASEWQKSNE